MNNFFVYDNETCLLLLNEGADILLIKEFADLMDPERNKCKEDPSGKYKLRAFREFKYIYLAICWKSPYADYPNRDKHEAALTDAEITEEEWNNPEFRAACRKFQTLQNSNRTIKMLEAARLTVDKFINYFTNIDPEERDEITGKPIYKVKDVMTEITQLSKVNDELNILESQVKKEMMEISAVRAGAVDGFMPD